MRSWPDGAKGFWLLIATTIVLGIGYMIGARRLIDWAMERRRA